jgi:hypothetical protein
MPDPAAAMGGRRGRGHQNALPKSDKARIGDTLFWKPSAQEAWWHPKGSTMYVRLYGPDAVSGISYYRTSVVKDIDVLKGFARRYPDMQRYLASYDPEVCPLPPPNHTPHPAWVWVGNQGTLHLGDVIVGVQHDHVSGWVIRPFPDCHQNPGRLDENNLSKDWAVWYAETLMLQVRSDVFLAEYIRQAGLPRKRQTLRLREVWAIPAFSLTWAQYFEPNPGGSAGSMRNPDDIAYRPDADTPSIRIGHTWWEASVKDGADHSNYETYLAYVGKLRQLCVTCIHANEGRIVERSLRIDHVVCPHCSTVWVGENGALDQRYCAGMDYWGLIEEIATRGACSCGYTGIPDCVQLCSRCSDPVALDPTEVVTSAHMNNAGSLSFEPFIHPKSKQILKMPHHWDEIPNYTPAGLKASGVARTVGQAFNPDFRPLQSERYIRLTPQDQARLLGSKVIDLHAEAAEPRE